MPERRESFFGGTDYLEGLAQRLDDLKSERQRLEQEGKEIPPELEEEIRDLDEDIENKTQEAIKQVEEMNKSEGWVSSEELTDKEREEIKKTLRKTLEEE